MVIVGTQRSGSARSGGKQLEDTETDPGPCFAGWANDPPMQPTSFKMTNQDFESNNLGQIALGVATHDADADDSYVHLPGGSHTST